MALNKSDQKKLISLLHAKFRNQARNNFLTYMKYTWMDTFEFLVGFHTRMMASRFDKALEDFENGISTYLLISIPPRHGKSEKSSVYLPPYFAAKFPGSEIMQVSYSTELATTFSEKGRRLAMSEKYRELFPSSRLSMDSKAKSDWKIVNDNGQTSAIRALGLNAGLNGKGYSLGILDDYCRNWKEIINPDNRTNSWNSFTTDFLTRRAPVSITIVVATQWHFEDINGRIKSEKLKNPDFPDFEVMAFPAKAKDYKGPGEYPGEWLFPERFDAKYYRQAYAMLGKKQSAALMDCNPVIDGGDVLLTENILYYDKNDENFPTVHDQKFIRVWDLAHTQKQLNKDDPDYTSGTLLAFSMPTNEDPIPHLYIRHVSRFRFGATKRNDRMKKIAARDGKFVKQYIENSIESKDAYDIIKHSNPGVSWNQVDMMGKGDKLVRVIPLEPIFEAEGHVHVLRGSYVDDWKNEIERFTGNGKEHDDQVDNLSSGYIICCDNGVRLSNDDMEAMRLMNGG